MGSGKTTKLKEFISDERFFGYSFYDLDLEIHKKYGAGFDSLGELIRIRGFEWFRSVEFERLKEIWNGPNSYVSLGGGSLTRETLSLIDSSDDIVGQYLEVPFEVCYERISLDKERPLVELGREKLLSLYKERLETYEMFKKL